MPPAVSIPDPQRPPGERVARKRTIAFLIGLGGSVLLVGGIEVGCRIALHARDRTESNVEGEYLREDPDLGYTLLPGSRVHAWSRLGSETIYDAYYNIDSLGHRVTLSGDPGAKRTVAFIGGSFVFGEGLDDDQTLPSAYALASPQDHVINLGIPGHGPNHVLARLERGELESLLSNETPSIVVYVFIDAHVARCVGSFFITTRFGRRAPYYRLDATSVCRVGDFESGRPLRSLLYRVLRKSAALEWSGFDWPRSDAADSLELTARVVQRCAQTFEEQVPGGRFVFVAYPGARLASAVLARAELPPMSVLDYTDLFDPASPGHSLAHDGHPSQHANRILAESLAQDLASR